MADAGMCMECGERPAVAVDAWGDDRLKCSPCLKRSRERADAADDIDQLRRDRDELAVALERALELVVSEDHLTLDERDEVSAMHALLTRIRGSK